ncbi:hypothetical protein V6N13_030123 [Hibiscus sabdariffa]
MSVTGENVNLTLSSSTESPKEPEKIEETPTSGTKRRKGKNHVEASPTEGGVDFESKTRCNVDGTIETVSVPKLWHFDQEEIRQALAKMVVLDELPFNFVEREGFCAFYKVAIPEFVPPSRATITRDCYALFIERWKALKDFFNNFSSRVCLTTDTWTSGQNLSYTSLTAHFIDDAWKLRKMIINFFPIADHSVELIGRAIEKCLQEWGLKKILTLTTDNASSHDLAIKYLTQILNLWDGNQGT